MGTNRDLFPFIPEAKVKSWFFLFWRENHVHSAEILEVIDLQLGGLGGLQGTGKRSLEVIWNLFT